MGKGVFQIYIIISDGCNAVFFGQLFPVMQTFLTLSLQDMASRVQLSGPQEAEKYVLHMVSQQHHLQRLYNNIKCTICVFLTSTANGIPSEKTSPE